MREPPRGRAQGPRGPRVGEREPDGPGDARLGRRAHEPRGAPRGDGPGRLPRDRRRLRESQDADTRSNPGMGTATVAAMAETKPDPTRIATEARDRVRFEEE